MEMDTYPKWQMTSHMAQICIRFPLLPLLATTTLLLLALDLALALILYLY
jgi:hypothetical protein